MSDVRAGSSVGQRLFAAAYQHRKRCLERGDATGGRLGAVFDKIVFSKMRALLGGQVRLQLLRFA